MRTVIGLDLVKTTSFMTIRIWIPRAWCLRRRDTSASSYHRYKEFSEKRRVYVSMKRALPMWRAWIWAKLTWNAHCYGVDHGLTSVLQGASLSSSQSGHTILHLVCGNKSWSCLEPGGPPCVPYVCVSVNGRGVPPIFFWYHSRLSNLVERERDGSRTNASGYAFPFFSLFF